MGISDISGLVSGGREPPELASGLHEDQEETKLGVGMMEWLVGIEAEDRKGTEGGTALTKNPPSNSYSLALSATLLMAVENWLRRHTHADGKPAGIIRIGYPVQGQVQYSITPRDVYGCIVANNQLVSGKPLHSLTIPACYPRFAQLYNNDPANTTSGSRFTMFNAATGNIVAGSKIDAKLFREWTQDHSHPQHDSLGLHGLEKWKQDAIASKMWDALASDGKGARKKQARLSNRKPYSRPSKPTSDSPALTSAPAAAQTSYQSSPSWTPTPQPAMLAPVAHPSKVIDLTSAFATPEPPIIAVDNPGLDFLDSNDIDLGGFFANGAPVASTSGTASSSGTSSAAGVGSDGSGDSGEGNVEENADADAEGSPESAGEASGEGSTMNVDG
ncbi:hypothetical protein V5O48_016194 [Marasmius crinis-equi]|uniref:Uncharacterized protein n=1 Tax=Marasmius crinis-equi TaxID=585013 RepID=A0ABR3ESF9_9AGAR